MSPQIFDVTIVITERDKDRLLPFLSSWGKLNQLFGRSVDIPDVKKLITLELIGFRRKVILDRLFGRLSKLQRVEYKRKIDRLPC
jgi:hypothetical protein